MTQYIKLAWRNLWRNKRRTIITSASVFFGVVLSSFMRSGQEGSYDQYIRAIVNSYTSYIQIHKKGYWNDKVINNTFQLNQSIESVLNKNKNITLYSPRFETFCLASSEDFTKGVMVFGIDLQREDKITNISGKLKQGCYLKNGDDGIILSSVLAKFLKLNVNDTLVLIGQGYHGTSAAGKFPVRGIIKHPSPELDRSLVIMEIKKCQELFSASGLLTSMAIMVHDDDEVAETKNALLKNLPAGLEVMDWKEMNELLLKQIESDRGGGVIEIGILYLIIAFGIFGTIVMMMAEREKEFGVILALGMQKYKLMLVLVLETVFIGMLGAITGILTSIPVLGYYHYHPIPFTGQAAEMMLEMGFNPAMFFSLDPLIFLKQALTIFIFTLIIGIYPVLNIWRLEITNALHN
ncbi:FtsX-like permease family protein [uncultured Bacteroides sp.]|uniref:ABC transporter permease n=1 Tax=uncultured Bacteroides sp. TaxID=162156 RepID=UPI002AAA6838|nr:FtsX-like permease family protein [uncultured Bacteroides sp.]